MESRLKRIGIVAKVCPVSMLVLVAIWETGLGGVINRFIFVESFNLLHDADNAIDVIIRMKKEQPLIYLGILSIRIFFGIISYSIVNQRY